MTGPAQREPAHWAAAYIGQPWTPEADCWQFVRRVWRDRFGIDVPAVPVDALSLRAAARAFRDTPVPPAWQEVDQPAEGDAVLMARGVRACHVGVWVGGRTPGILHAMERTGVVLTPRGRIAGAGYRILAFYRHRRPRCAQPS